MQIAIVLYENLTVLDAVGPYDTLGHLPGADVVFVAEQAGPVRNDRGHLSLIATKSFDEVTSPDIVIVPGGPDRSAQLDNKPLQDWLRAVDPTTTWTTSVCTGSLALAAAGLLDGRRATTHWLAREDLAALGAEMTVERVVFDGKYVTAAGVSAGIDMGLMLAEKIAGEFAAQSIQLMVEYDPQPPHEAGSPEKAPAELVAHWRAQAAA
ncbi:DJ-1/PfpI family protein [Streptomyces sp. NPDC051561]|uniref:DJ-1/PfpI family protein n=1 Tax=Streptomyces sp. NPDC051561 TaxID=3365658 RepID=UPI003789B073